jgi:hypothetical protein
LTRRLSRAEIGNRVFSALTQDAYTIEEGVEVTGLSLAQWRTGLQYVRDVLAYNPDAITYDAARKKYHLDVAGVEFFVTHQICLFTQQLRHLYDGEFVPPGCDSWSSVLAEYRLFDERVQQLIGDLAAVSQRYLHPRMSEPEVRIAP